MTKDEKARVRETILTPDGEDIELYHNPEKTAKKLAARGKELKERDRKIAVQAKADETMFLKMEAELAQYNKDYGEGKNPKEPIYDRDIFSRFRDWQQKRLIKLVNDNFNDIGKLRK
jgi:hypothetical protein